MFRGLRVGAYIVTGILLVHVIQVLRGEASSVSWPDNAMSVALDEVPGEHPIKVALDEIDVDPVGNKEMTREAIPFLSKAQSKVESLDRTEVGSWRFVVLVLSTRWWRWGR